MDLDPGFSTRESRQIFGLAGRLHRMLDTEAALALASAKVGFIPHAAAEAIADACAQENFDALAIFAHGWEAGTPLIPLVAELEQRAGAQSTGFVHRGATSQDIIDTGLVLQMQTGLTTAGRAMLGIAATLSDLVAKHRMTPILGRTLLQPASATTFGSKVAGWLDAAVANIERMRTVATQLPLQLGGMVGDRERFGGHGEALARHMARHLGLALPRRSWHTCREPVIDAATSLAAATRTAAKIAYDLALLAQAEVGEVSMRAGGSSATAGKRNPIDAVRTRAAAQLALGQAATLLTSPPYEHERGAGPWQAEWVLVPLLFHGALAAFEALGRALTSLRVDTVRMATNLGSETTTEQDHTDRDRMIDHVLAAFERLEP